MLIHVCSFAERDINICAELTEMQKKWYLSVLAKDIDAVNGECLLCQMGLHFICDLSLTSKECKTHL